MDDAGPGWGHRWILFVLLGVVALVAGLGLARGESDETTNANETANANETPSANETASANEFARCVAPPDAGRLENQDMRDYQVPWKRNGRDKVTIYFEARGLTDEYRGFMDQGAQVWNRSPCLDVRIVDSCPAQANCVTTSLTKGHAADGNFDSVEEGSFTVGGHIDLYFEELDKQGAGAKLNVTIHEMGHGVGLRHRSTERVLMNGETYTDVFEPDETDYRNLLVLYGSQQ